jgi:hypothetical protein
MNTRACLLVLLICLSAFTTAVASPLLFTLTGNPGDTISFTLPSNPASLPLYTAGPPASGQFLPDPGDGMFSVANVPIGSTTYNVVFSNNTMGGGLWIYPNYMPFILVNQGGPQLYTGGENNPTFLTGTFQLQDVSVSSNWPATYTENFTLNISQSNISSAPEPASLALVCAAMPFAYRKWRQRRQQI